MTQSIKDIAGGKYVLWGASWSLYTAKVRPYLIKKGIDYVEVCPSHPEYNDRIIPTVGYFTVPVLETRMEKSSRTPPRSWNIWNRSFQIHQCCQKISLLLPLHT